MVEGKFPMRPSDQSSKRFGDYLGKDTYFDANKGHDVHTICLPGT